MLNDLPEAIVNKLLRLARIRNNERAADAGGRNASRFSALFVGACEIAAILLQAQGWEVDVETTMDEVDILLARVEVGEAYGTKLRTFTPYKSVITVEV